MRVSILNQKAGSDPIGDEINEFLLRRKAPLTHVKFLMAFVNKNGLRYMKDALEQYYDAGGVVEFIIGIDNGVTTYDALKYLRRRFPDASLFIFHDNSPSKMFHHKVIIFESEKTVASIIGSANLTLGGMFSNYESAFVAELDRIKDSEVVQAISRMWDGYRNPQKPLDPRNLQALTDAWLQEHGATLRKNSKRQIRNLGQAAFPGFVATELPRPKLSGWPREKRSKKKNARTPADSDVREQKLLIQVLKETGAGGTQVQLPAETLTTYFKGTMKRPIPVRLSFSGDAFRDGYIYHFYNDTHRISIRELGGVPRPALLVFKKLSNYQNSYRCYILRGVRYRRSLHDCNRQTRAGAKKWGLLD